MCYRLHVMGYGFVLRVFIDQFKQNSERLALAGLTGLEFPLPVLVAPGAAASLYLFCL